MTPTYTFRCRRSVVEAAFALLCGLAVIGVCDLAFGYAAMYGAARATPPPEAALVPAAVVLPVDVCSDVWVAREAKQ